MSKTYVASRSLLAALGFTVVMMVAAVVIRRVIFGDYYIEQGFFAATAPSAGLVAIGLAIKFFFGLFAAMIFGHLASVQRDASILRMVFMFGAMHFVAADLGYLGRANVAEPLAFLAIEGAITVVGFAAFGVILKRLFLSGAQPSHSTVAVEA